MAHSKQAKKRDRQNEKRRAHNRVIASRMRTEVRKIVRAAQDGDVDTVVSLAPLAMKHVDKAAKINLIHKNNAARKKSTIAAALKKVQAAKAAG